MGGLADSSRTLELESRIRALEQEVEQRSQAAFQQGRQQGESTARQQLQGQTDTMLQQLAHAVQEISGLRQQCRHQAEDDTVKLSLAIARRILHRELTIDPGAMLGLVKAALDKLDAREVHRIRVHPDFAPVLKQHLERIGAPRRVEVEADSGLERGAAVFETTRGTLDASADSQLTEIERGFTDLVRHTK